MVRLLATPVGGAHKVKRGIVTEGVTNIATTRYLTILHPYFARASAPRLNANIVSHRSRHLVPEYTRSYHMCPRRLVTFVLCICLSVIVSFICRFCLLAPSVIFHSTPDSGPTYALSERTNSPFRKPHPPAEQNNITPTPVKHSRNREGSF